MIFCFILRYVKLYSKRYLFFNVIYLSEKNSKGVYPIRYIRSDEVKSHEQVLNAVDRGRTNKKINYLITKKTGHTEFHPKIKRVNGVGKSPIRTSS